MRKKILKVSLLIFLISLPPVGYYSLKPAFTYYSGYLSKSEPVDANILIVEGWLHERAMVNIYSEFQKKGYEYIITTGLKLTAEYYKLHRNGYLIFYPKNKTALHSDTVLHTIEISAFSELEGENRAHFNVFVNDSLVAGFTADKKKRKYLVNLEEDITKIDSVMIHFDNDKVGDFGDRNLYIKEISINRKTSIPFLNYSEYDIGKLDGKARIINNYNSNAELTRNRLISMGIDPSSIIAVPGERVKINRTLTSALAVRDWLKTNDPEINGINIVSSGTHARRTWMTYTRILKKSYNIGIISLPDYVNDHSRKKRLIKTLRETTAIMYYWFILLPY